MHLATGRCKSTTAALLPRDAAVALEAGNIAIAAGDEGAARKQWEQWAPPAAPLGSGNPTIAVRAAMGVELGSSAHLF